MKVTELSPRQRRVLHKLAEGLPPSQVALETGYRPETVSRLHRSELGRTELERLRAVAEAALAEALPKLVADAVTVLQRQLESPLLEIRTQAAYFVLAKLTPKPTKDVARQPGNVFEVVTVDDTSRADRPGSPPLKFNKDVDHGKTDLQN